MGVSYADCNDSQPRPRSLSPPLVRCRRYLTVLGWFHGQTVILTPVFCDGILTFLWTIYFCWTLKQHIIFLHSRSGKQSSRTQGIVSRLFDHSSFPSRRNNTRSWSKTQNEAVCCHIHLAREGFSARPECRYEGRTEAWIQKHSKASEPR